MNETLPDWTTGTARLVYQRCPRCAGVWYFRRSFCPSCGSAEVEAHEAGGHGTVHAVTSIARAPTPDWQALAPYTIVLVDAPEGFRIMAHGDEGLSIGDPVRLTWLALGDKLVPLFTADA